MPVALQLVCHDATCDVLNHHVRTQLIEQDTASVVHVIRHEGDHTFSASPNPPCSHYAAHLSGLPVQTIPEGAIVLHIAQGCSGMHVVAHTHQHSAIVLPTEDASHNSILHSIQHVLGHGMCLVFSRLYYPGECQCVWGGWCCIKQLHSIDTGIPRYSRSPLFIFPAIYVPHRSSQMCWAVHSITPMCQVCW